MRFPAVKQRRMDHLIQSSKRRDLTPSESKELEKLLDDVQLLNLAWLNSEARQMRESATVPKRRRTTRAA